MSGVSGIDSHFLFHFIVVNVVFDPCTQAKWAALFSSASLYSHTCASSFPVFHSAFAIQMLSLTAISLSQRATLFVFLCFAALLFLDFQIPLDGHLFISFVSFAQVTL